MYPEQWEGWFYLHKFIDTKELKEAKIKKHQLLKTKGNDFDINKKYILNNDKYSIMVYEIADFLLDKETYELFKLPKELVEVLAFFKTPQKPCNFTSSTFKIMIESLQELYEMNILVRS